MEQDFRQLRREGYRINICLFRGVARDLTKLSHLCIPVGYKAYKLLNVSLHRYYRHFFEFTSSSSVGIVALLGCASFVLRFWSC